MASVVPAAAAVAEAAAAAAAAAAVPVAALAAERAAPIVFATAVLDIAAESSALRLRSFAERCRHEEGVARCPFVLLQALALVRQFQCMHPPPLAQQQQKRYAQSLKAHVWSFCSCAANYKWRGKLALVLYELQQTGNAAALQQMLNAMARVHVSVLERLLRGLWFPNNPLFLTRTLEEVSTQRLSHHAVTTMLAHSHIKDLKRQPPESLAATEAAVTALLLHAKSPPADMQATPTVPYMAGGSGAAQRDKRKRHSIATVADEALQQEGKEEAAKTRTSDDEDDDAATAASAEPHPRDPKKQRTNSPPTPSREPLTIAIDGPQRMELDGEAASPSVDAAHVSTPELPPPSGDTTVEAAVADVDAVPPGEDVASPAAAPSPRRSTREAVGTTEQKQIGAALRASEANLKERPLIVITPEQRRVYAAHVRQQLQDRHLELRTVPGNGDCILAAVLLGCKAAGIDVCAEQVGLASPVHASHLRVFLAAWIREHKQVLFDISGGDESWRGEALTIRKLCRGGISCRPSRTRLTLDGCLDLFADTSERKWDILWASTEPGALQTNLGDHLPQLLACALNIRIVLIKSSGPPEVVGARDAGQQLTAESGREIVLVQSVRQDHWDAALPTVEPVPPAIVSASEQPPSTAAVAPATPISTPFEHPSSATTTPSSECAVNSTVRRRIFADPPSAVVAQLEAELAAARLKQAEEIRQMQQQHQQLELLQLCQQHAAEKERVEDEQTHTIAHAVETTAKTMHDIERLTCALLTENQNHRARVCDASVADAVAEALEQLLALQASLPASRPQPFLSVSQDDLEQWTSDLEVIEAALGRPFHQHEPTPVDCNGAQQLCELMIRWLTQLDDASGTLSFLDLLLLCKKLLCMDQLRPDTPHGTHFRLFEVHALTSRLFAHARVWPHVVRVSISYFNSAREHMACRSARYYVKAVKAAGDDVQQRVRLVVEQCKVLESVGRLQDARKAARSG